MAIKDYSTTPDMNTTISGINIAEGCAPSGINNAIRQLMADVKAEQTTQATKDAAQDAAIAGKLDKSGGTVVGPVLFKSNQLDLTETPASNVYGNWVKLVDKNDRPVIEMRGVKAPDSSNVVEFALADNTGITRYPMTISIKEGSESAVLNFRNGMKVAINEHPVVASNDDVLLTPGMVVAYAANRAPAGFLLCNGAAVSRTTYAALFAAIGTTYGSGDGSTTFNLPNLMDRVIQGSGTAGTEKAAGLPEIMGTVKQIAMQSKDTKLDADGAFALTNQGNAQGGGTSISNTYDGVEFKASRYNAIYGASATVQPPALTMRFYIKY